MGMFSTSTQQSLSSSSLACPSIWGRRYSSVCCVVLFQPHICHHLSLLHTSFHLMFGRPLLLFHVMSTCSILLTMCSSFILLTWPYHFSRFSVIFLDDCTTVVVPLMCSFRILSLLVILHAHLTIVISFTSSRASSPLVIAHVYAPYNIVGLTIVL